jgi:6,7-dimethyl-8-ribityllumazine synthase
MGENDPGAWRRGMSAGRICLRLHALIHVGWRHDMNQTSISKQPKIAFVQACWHAEIVDRSRQGFLAELARQGCDEERVETWQVPGAYDIPLMAKKLAVTGHYGAIVAAGFVVDGGIYRHDFVASTVIDALMQVQLETGTPVISAVLTPHQFQEHDPHIAFFADHFVIKGQEAADACLKIMGNFARLQAADIPAVPASAVS